MQQWLTEMLSKKTAFIIGMLLFSQMAIAQYTLPSILYDSMAFEVSRGRQCNKLVFSMEVEIQKGLAVEVKLTDELTKTQEQLKATQEALELSNAEKSETKVLYKNQVELTKFEQKQKSKWKFAALALIVIEGIRLFVGN